MTHDLAKKNVQIATLAGGCFWCIEGAFNSVKGIEKAISGYMGGETTAPTYEEICKGDTGHAEVVQLHFDTALITYRQILEIFFSLHNPTHLNRQGNDIGTQYRSAIFTHDEAQKNTALAIIAEISQGDLFDDEVVTLVSDVETFYAGEDYHQDYFKNNPENQYCQAVVSPKLAKFRKTFVEMLK
jgi:peptide-methionine (S)-S-oxide reductase